MSMNSTPETFATLQKLREEKKFIAESFYPGAPTEQIRSRCEASVNIFLDGVLADLRRSAKKEDLFARAKKLHASIEEEDTEEREKADDYVGKAMRAVGLDDWTDHV